MYTIYKTILNGENLHQGDRLDSAIRAWDRKSFNTPVTDEESGIQVQTWDMDPVNSPASAVMVRDGWILHVFPDNRTYLSPCLTTTD